MFLIDVIFLYGKLKYHASLASRHEYRVATMCYQSLQMCIIRYKNYTHKNIYIYIHISQHTSIRLHGLY